MLFFFGYPVELYRKRYVIRIDRAEIFDQFHANNAELPVKNRIHYQQEKKINYYFEIYFKNEIILITLF